MYVDWPYNHGRRGTCEPHCERFSRCHCRPDCPARTTIANHSQSRDGSRKGMPRVFAFNHHVNPAHLEPGMDESKGYVSVERVKPMLRKLREHYGRQYIVAELLGVQDRVLRSWERGPTRFISPKNARAITVAVLALRRPKRDLFATFDVDDPPLDPRENRLASLIGEFSDKGARTPWLRSDSESARQRRADRAKRLAGPKPLEVHQYTGSSRCWWCSHPRSHEVHRYDVKHGERAAAR